MSGYASITAGSQTVGPYFRIGLDYLLERTPALTLAAPGTIEITGRVLDRDGAPVPDAMLEFWSPAEGAEAGVFPAGFRRVPTDGDGKFSVVVLRPTTVPPHLLVLVFARGLMRHLISRVYFSDEPANDGDPVLMSISEERRATLIAQPDQGQANLYKWDVVLQGTGETVFFAW